jgi:hypothetical protein
MFYPACLHWACVCMHAHKHTHTHQINDLGISLLAFSCKTTFYIGFVQEHCFSMYLTWHFMAWHDWVIIYTQIKYSFSSSSISFITVCGVWLSQPGPLKPSCSAPVSSSFSHVMLSCHCTHHPTIFLLGHPVHQLHIGGVWVYFLDLSF